MKYSSLNAEELAADIKFRNWILHPNPDNERRWQSWLEQYPDKQETVRNARRLVLVFGEEQDPLSIENEYRLWKSIQHTVDVADKENLRTEKRPPIKVYKENLAYKRVMAIAAVLVGLLFIVGWFVQQQTKKERPQQSLAKEAIVREVPKGQKHKLYLPDGSFVVLNAQSTLRYYNDYGLENREVYLEGEAYFEVKHDADRAFVVRSADLITNVLGTTFNVNAYPEQENVTVSLIEGKVEIRHINEQEAITLIPGEMANLDYESGHIHKGKITNMQALKWRDGVLVLQDTELREAFDKLEIWYGVDFHIDNLPEDKKVTGVFEQEYLNNVLQSVQYSVKFDFEIKEDQVFVKFK